MNSTSGPGLCFLICKICRVKPTRSCGHWPYHCGLYPQKPRAKANPFSLKLLLFRVSIMVTRKVTDPIPHCVLCVWGQSVFFPFPFLFYKIGLSSFNLCNTTYLENSKLLRYTWSLLVCPNFLSSSLSCYFVSSFLTFSSLNFKPLCLIFPQVRGFFFSFLFHFYLQVA